MPKAMESLVLGVLGYLSIQVCFFRYSLVQVKSAKYIPRRMSTPFFESDREILHTSSMCRCEDLTYCCIFLFFPCFFVSYDFLENVDHLGPTPNTFSEKKKRRSCRTRVRNVRVYLSKTAWTFELLCVNE